MYKQTNKKNLGKVLCFGELLFRISLDAEGNWLKKNNVPFYMGGAELNVATALALWDVPVQYFTALPANHMSAQISTHLKDKGIDSEKTYYHGERVGLYILTKGADIKNDSLIYDRAHSAFAELKPGMIDWDKVLDGVSWFHFSAICPAVNQNVADVCKEALIAASAKNITISIDLNYRSKLWKYGKSPEQVIPELVSYCDLVMGNIWAAETMLGIPVEDELLSINKKENYLEAALKTSRYITEHYPKCKTVANTFRFDADGGITYYTSLYTGGEYYNTTDYAAAKIVNKVGSGDCFMAGLIYGFYNQRSPAEILEFATAAAFDKLFLEGDATCRTSDEIKNVITK
ncbi:sugar kinase [Mucilaginibacter sp. L196]|uniref:sugar kinase n=1 Tax=Mucilaginibacter sp. L196 TaxID=1641870 RepID=UPI00131E1B4D|nr:sugar kinase [Mucilaginibacter sp. L196]